MVTTRTPISRRTRGRITSEVVALFKRMEAAREQCTCPPIDWTRPDGHWKNRPDDCAACEEWWSAHNRLHDLLGLFPHEWPAFEYPDAECPYPPDCFAAAQWHKRRAERPAAFALYRELKKAAA
jgi:hypothetical protein